MESNVQKMREALKAFVNAYKIDNELDNIEATQIAFVMAKEALALPLRNCDAESVDSPLSTTTTKDHHALCQPLVLGQHSGAECRPIDKPCPTIATAAAMCEADLKAA